MWRSSRLWFRWAGRCWCRRGGRRRRRRGRRFFGGFLVACLDRSLGGFAFCFFASGRFLSLSVSSGVVVVVLVEWFDRVGILYCRPVGFAPGEEIGGSTAGRNLHRELFCHLKEPRFR